MGRFEVTKAIYHADKDVSPEHPLYLDPNVNFSKRNHPIEKYQEHMAHHIRVGWADMLAEKHAKDVFPEHNQPGHPMGVHARIEQFKGHKQAYKHHLLHGQAAQQELQDMPPEHFMSYALTPEPISI